ncbi:MAG TPA: RsmD family RNA methyltransferase [Bacteroidales bacterium]|nr:RsmD family RNA methyltransferase [Bacteroidales bacterium]
MRIIGGKYRGRQINPPSGFRARPTTDFARESLFNILTNRLVFEGLEVLDLFAGTGSIGIEFVSRGAELVHQVDIDRRNIGFIRKIAGELKINNIKAMHIDARDFLKTCRHRYDIVFADPPYDLPWLGEIPDLVLGAGILKDDGKLILEHPAGYSFNGHYCFSEQRKYGRVNFSFFTSVPRPLP